MCCVAINGAYYRQSNDGPRPKILLHNALSIQYGTCRDLEWHNICVEPLGRHHDTHNETNIHPPTQQKDEQCVL
jgi:hypothetical protein